MQRTGLSRHTSILAPRRSSPRRNPELQHVLSLRESTLCRHNPLFPASSHLLAGQDSDALSGGSTLFSPLFSGTETVEAYLTIPVRTGLCPVGSYPPVMRPPPPPPEVLPYWGGGEGSKLGESYFPLFPSLVTYGKPRWKPTELFRPQASFSTLLRKTRPSSISWKILRQIPPFTVLQLPETSHPVTRVTLN